MSVHASGKLLDTSFNREGRNTRVFQPKFHSKIAVTTCLPMPIISLNAVYLYQFPPQYLPSPSLLNNPHCELPAAARPHYEEAWKMLEEAAEAPAAGQVFAALVQAPIPQAHPHLRTGHAASHAAQDLEIAHESL